MLHSLSIRVTREVLIVPDREPPLPSVTYGNVGKGVPRVQNGSWNILDMKFHVGGQMRNWKILVVRDGVEALSFKGPRDERLINFIKAFNNNCKNSGMDVGKEPPAILTTDQLPSVRDDPGRHRALENILWTIESFGEAKNISLSFSCCRRKTTLSTWASSSCVR